MRHSSENQGVFGGKKLNKREVLKINAGMVKTESARRPRSPQLYPVSPAEPWYATHPVAPSLPLPIHPLSQHHHMTSGLWIRSFWQALSKHGCQTISSPFRVPTSDGDQWNPKLICYHMPRVTDSSCLQKLALVIMSGPSFPMYRSMCTNHADPAKS